MHRHAYGELPFLGVSRHDLRHAIVSVLAEKWPLTAKQTFSLIEKKPFDVTYQGVHKALKQLKEEGVVSENRGEYELSVQWIHLLRDSLTQISQAYAGFDKVNLEKLPGDRLKLSSRTFELLERMISNKLVVWDRETMFLFGNRVHVCPSAFMVSLVKKLEERMDVAVLYNAAREMGKEWISGVQRKTGIKSINEITAHGSDILAFAGWASFYIKHMETNPIKIVVGIDNSPLAKEYVKKYGNVKHPVDHFLRGCFAGGYSIPFNEPTLEFIETKCIAKGDRHCEFLGMRRKDFNLKDKKIARQIGPAKMHPF